MSYVSVLYLDCKVYEKREDGMIIPKVLNANSYVENIVEADTQEECEKKQKKIFDNIVKFIEG